MTTLYLQNGFELKAAVLTLDRVNELFDYNKETGDFYRRVGVSNRSAGKLNLKPSVNGYLRVRIDGNYYYLHRLALFISSGVFPKDDVDHINGIRTDNRIVNLRLAKRSENLQNIKLASKAESGLRGAYLDKKLGKWQSKMMVNYKRISLGYYDTALEAHEAYLTAKRKYHSFNPEFTR